MGKYAVSLIVFGQSAESAGKVDGYEDIKMGEYTKIPCVAHVLLVKRTEL